MEMILNATLRNGIMLERKREVQDMDLNELKRRKDAIGYEYDEIAELAVFLCSDSSNGIIGQTIVCDGGALL